MSEPLGWEKKNMREKNLSRKNKSLEGKKTVYPRETMREKMKKKSEKN